MTKNTKPAEEYEGTAAREELRAALISRIAHAQLREESIDSLQEFFVDETSASLELSSNAWLTYLAEQWGVA